METKITVSDFAAITGTTAKTIYQKIVNNEELPVNERLKTIKEKIKGREITLIITNSEQIEFYKNLYQKSDKLTVNNPNCKETLTDNNSFEKVNDSNQPPNVNANNTFNTDIINNIITLNENYNNRLELVYNELKTTNNELIEVKSKQLLLEDKASREGFYLNEINTLKADYKKLSNVNKLLIIVIMTLILLITIALTGFITVNNMEKSVNSPAVMVQDGSY